ncbi:MAG TPA: DUF2244 domain-containing protein [Casimicrobiaceae bacterium]|nr:DUF2244 domain-containing protein [Casimicrobiaceae bacterium]
MLEAAILPTAGEGPAEFSLTARCHDALGSRGRWRLFASLCALSFGFALVFAMLGAWLVLPYSCLEMAVLFWAFRYFERRAADWERISVCGDRVIVEAERSGVFTRQIFNRRWLQIELEDQGFGRPLALALRYAGRRTSFGDSLPADEKLRVSRELRRLLAAEPRFAVGGGQG